MKLIVIAMIGSALMFMINIALNQLATALPWFVVFMYQVTQYSEEV